MHDSSMKKEVIEESLTKCLLRKLAPNNELYSLLSPSEVTSFQEELSVERENVTLLAALQSPLRNFDHEQSHNADAHTYKAFFDFLSQSLTHHPRSCAILEPHLCLKFSEVCCCFENSQDPTSSKEKSKMTDDTNLVSHYLQFCL